MFPKRSIMLVCVRQHNRTQNIFILFSLVVSDENLSWISIATAVWNESSARQIGIWQPTG